ncbi:hypothetical protein ACJX0J_031048, partial [Zea mays]
EINCAKFCCNKSQREWFIHRRFSKQVAQVELCGENDMFKWNLSVPLKIKIFMWYLIKGVFLTKKLIVFQDLNIQKYSHYNLWIWIALLGANEA